jgi:hypothetical protein
MKNDDHYIGIIEYHEPGKHDWMLNDVELDSFIAFTERCYRASRIAILDLYLDMGMILRMPFLTFIMKLISDKHRKEACKFELVDDTISIDDVYAIIESSLFTSDSKWKCDRNFDTIENAFRQLADANPFEEK